MKSRLESIFLDQLKKQGRGCEISTNHDFEVDFCSFFKALRAVADLFQPHVGQVRKWMRRSSKSVSKACSLIKRGSEDMHFYDFPCLKVDFKAKIGERSMSFHAPLAVSRWTSRCSSRALCWKMTSP